MIIVVPLPSILCAIIFPFDSLIIPYDMDNPMPVPDSESFVEKKGSKILHSTS